MSADPCMVCGTAKTIKMQHGEELECFPGGCGQCCHATRLAIERGQELARLKNESITAEIELAAGQPALILSAYDMPINWRPGDIVRITLETPLTNAGKSESTKKEE